MAFFKLSTGTPPTFIPTPKSRTAQTFNFYWSGSAAPTSDWASVGSIPTPGTGWFWTNMTTVAAFTSNNTDNYVTTDA